jgi:hypothetical protein
VSLAAVVAALALLGPAIPARADHNLAKLTCLTIWVDSNRGPLNDAALRDATVAAVRSHLPHVELHPPRCPDILGVRLSYTDVKTNSGEPVGYAASIRLQLYRVAQLAAHLPEIHTTMAAVWTGSQIFVGSPSNGPVIDMVVKALQFPMRDLAHTRAKDNVKAPTSSAPGSSTPETLRPLVAQGWLPVRPGVPAGQHGHLRVHPGL